MTTLKVGRVGLSTPTLPNVTDWSTRAQERGQRHSVDGWLEASSLANAKALRTELTHQTGKLIAVTLDDDDSFDGYYIQRGASIDLRSRYSSLNGSGLFAYGLDLEWIGSHASVEFMSNLTGFLMANDHGMTAGEVSFWHAPPIEGDDAYTAGGGTSAQTRVTADGTIPVFTGITFTNSLAAARWGCAPANWYDGAVSIEVDSYTRAGLVAPMSPDAIVIGNGIIEIRAEASGGATIGDFGIRGYNSGWGSWTPFDVVWNSTTDIPKWHFSNIVRNDAEQVTAVWQRDADEAPPTDDLHTLFVTLRRGAPFATFHYTYSSAVALTIDRATTDAGTSVTPTGATSANMAVRDAADDGDGNRWVVGASKTITADTTNGGIDLASAASHDFFLGFEIGGSGAASEDDADAICQQYLAQSSERVQAVIR